MSNDTTTGKSTRRAGKRAVTVTDIAQAVGVSRATVSLVLRGSPLVNVDTRAKVEAEPKLEGRQMVMVLAPKKKAAPAGKPESAA